MNIQHNIYFARHGESSANLTHITTPHDQDVLTEKGKMQAELNMEVLALANHPAKRTVFSRNFATNFMHANLFLSTILLGKYLREQNVHFTKAYASPYPRATDSAKLILMANNDGLRNAVNVREEPRIREREFGDFMGKPAMDAYHALEAAYKLGTPVLQFEMPGSEKASEFENRLDSFLDDLLRDLRVSQKSETVLIVSHGICMFRMLGKLRSRTILEVQMEEFKQACYRPMPNTGYHLLTLELPDALDFDPRKVPLQFQLYHQKPHLAQMEKEEQGVDQKSDFLKMAQKLKMDLDMVAECALQ